MCSTRSFRIRLYVTDVTAGTTGRWKRIFLADITPPGSRAPSATERGDSPRVTLASEAIVAPDPSQNRLQLALQNGSTYEAGKAAADYHITMFPAGDQLLEAKKPDEVRAIRVAPEMDTRPLYRQAYEDTTIDRATRLDARTEFNERFAMPLACLLMALIGVPLGITRRRAGEIGGRGDDGSNRVPLLHVDDWLRGAVAARNSVGGSCGVASRCLAGGVRHLHGRPSGEAGRSRSARHDRSQSRHCVRWRNLDTCGWVRSACSHGCRCCHR